MTVIYQYAFRSSNRYFNHALTARIIIHQGLMGWLRDFVSNSNVHRSSWLSTCSSNLSTSLQHPSSDSWRLRTIRSFGGELAELGPSDPSDPSEWRRRFLRLARACHATSNLKDLAKNNRLSKEMFLRREFQLGETPTWDLELHLSSESQLI